jgi:predicted RNase H-like nuclease (RuvC/YqgF family)
MANRYLRGQIAALTRQNDRLQTRITTLQARNNYQRRRISTLEDRTDTFQTDTTQNKRLNGLEDVCFLIIFVKHLK